jgi:ABC-type polysaccharide/polyol phosphate transport system ATPase subunit
MNKRLKEIEEFSELGRFLDMPVRSYSDGMKVRLGFSIVTCINPDILILDEAIGAGDAHFLEKATKRAQELYERANIIVMASHDQNIIRHLCNKVAWLDQGHFVKIGPVDEVLEAYAKAA